MGSWRCDGNKAAAGHDLIADGFHADESCIEVGDLRRRRYKDIDGTRVRVRMLALHVHDALVFGGLQFRQVRVYRRRLSRVRMHVEKRRVEHGKKKRRYCAEDRQFSHGAILPILQFEVNVGADFAIRP